MEYAISADESTVIQKEFSLKRYDNLDDLLLVSYTIEHPDDPIGIDELKEIDFGGLSPDNQEIQFSYAQMAEGIKEQGYWGFIDENRVIHFWTGKELSIPELIYFFAHEIGHRTGNPSENNFEEEMRAEDFAYVARLAYRFAKQTYVQ